MKKLLLIVLTLFLLLGSGNIINAEDSVIPDDSSDIVEEVEAFGVKGIDYNVIKKSDESYTNTITVTPAGTYYIDLQYNNGSSYKTIASYTTDHDGIADVEFPDDYWANASHTKWRIIVNATPDTEKYISDDITLYTSNRDTLKLYGDVGYIYNIEHQLPVYQKNTTKQHEIASITKIMTAILAIENCDLDDEVTISSTAAKTSYSHILLTENEKVTVKNLLYAAMLPSSNGAARALGEHVAGSQSDFAKLMNEKAKELGCTNTHFVNCHGLHHKDHYSTAHDVALILAYAYQNSTFRKIIGTTSYTYQNVDGTYTCPLASTNKLLTMSGVEGGKTGFTDEAGKCYAGVFSYKGEHYVTVTLGCKTSKKRWHDAKHLISYIKYWYGNPYTIYYHTDGGEIDDYSPRTYNGKQTVTLLKATKRNYFFKGWYTSAALKTKITTIKKGKSGHKHLYAKWSKVKVKKARKPKVKNIKKKKIIATWKKTTSAKGYQLQYSTDKTFIENVKTKSTKKKSSTVKCDKKGTYYVHVRAYRLDSTGHKVYGLWSTPVTVKVKK